MNHLSVRNLHKQYDGSQALAGASFEMQQGEFFTIMGPTNAGKSTLLKCLAGIEKPEQGAIILNGRDLGTVEPGKRNLSLLFQNIALFPNRSGFDNIAFPLRVAKRPETEIRGRVEEIASQLRISHVLDRLPQTFSGGEQQRVAIGRAIAHPSDLLMLDEPLTNLDARIRIALRLQFKRLHASTAQSILYVTHDQGEALSLSDRIGVLRDGAFEQIGTPDDIYQRPSTEFVARFVGSPPMNILPATLSTDSGALMATGDGFVAPVSGTPTAVPDDAAIGVRPEDILIERTRTRRTPNAAKVTYIEKLGSHNILDVGLGKSTIRVRTAPGHGVVSEGLAWIGFRVRPYHILDRRSEKFCRSESQRDENDSKEEQTCA